VYTRAIGSSFDSIGLHIITARYLPGGLDSHRWYKSPQIEARIDVVPKKRVTSPKPVGVSIKSVALAKIVPVTDETSESVVVTSNPTNNNQST
jgi:hypothetical protein